MVTLSLDDIPVEPTVTVIDPSGNSFITTNNPTTLQYIRLEIKKNRMKGYTLCTSDGDIIEIYSNGKLSAWPEDKIPGDVFDKLTRELI